MNKPRTGAQRGAALILALLVFALATTLVVAMSREFTLFLKRGSNSFRGEQAWAYLLGGEELAAAALREDSRRDGVEPGVAATAAGTRDDLTELWAQPVPPYALDEGWLHGRLQALDGRININALAGAPAEGQRFSAAQEQFARLLQTPAQPRVSERQAVQITTALLDWLDADQIPRALGAEDDHYYSMTPPYRAANRPMRSVSELRLVAGMTPALFDAVAPYLTVWGGGASINIHTAPAPVLRTLNGAGDLLPLSHAVGEALVAEREQQGFADVQALLASPALYGVTLAPELIQRLGGSSEWFLYAGEVDVSGRRARLYSVLHRDTGFVRVVVRSTGAL